MDADMIVKLGVIVAVLGVLWVLPDWDTYRDRALRLGRGPRQAEPAQLRPSGPPIERIAADAQRIRAQIEHAPAGVPVARRRGWQKAYDDVLVAACQALGLEARLDALPEGIERDLERERVERLLAAAGLLLRPTA